MKSRAKSTLIYALFFGGIWGIAEATLGYLLNLSTIGISGCIMFPIGYVILRKAYKQSNNVSVIFYSSLIAGTIKLVNLFMPISHPVKVINPAFAIVLEGLSVMALVSWSVKKNREIGFTSALITGFSWRIIYFIDAVILYNINIPARMIEKGPKEYILNFLIINNLINAVIIMLVVRAEKNGKTINIKGSFIKPVTAVCSFVLAVCVQILMTYIKTNS
ncbi:hypothetical protein SH1V18_07580 [Vallitalea longa]|uniref:Uncharacterized protein n=1 Tax=Vallitalea longa TaxID=2936439 RepID=A0A9W6DEC3_9FIRM|nr:hypothetical protein [Vallitalea longa]GKX28278.1 hypothetical protein SH1V18_07580 [Vallitalea longa]